MIAAWLVVETSSLILCIPFFRMSSSAALSNRKPTPCLRNAGSTLMVSIPATLVPFLYKMMINPRTIVLIVSTSTVLLAFVRR